MHCMSWTATSRPHCNLPILTCLGQLFLLLSVSLIFYLFIIIFDFIAQFEHLCDIHQWLTEVKAQAVNWITTGIAKSDKAFLIWKSDIRCEELFTAAVQWFDASIDHLWWRDLYPLNVQFVPLAAAKSWLHFIGVQMKLVFFLFFYFFQILTIFVFRIKLILVFLTIPLNHLIYGMIGNLQIILWLLAKHCLRNKNVFNQFVEIPRHVIVII